MSRRRQGDPCLPQHEEEAAAALGLDDAALLQLILRADHIVDRVLAHGHVGDGVPERHVLAAQRVDQRDEHADLGLLRVHDLPVVRERRFERGPQAVRDRRQRRDAFLARPQQPLRLGQAARNVANPLDQAVPRRLHRRFRGAPDFALGDRHARQRGADVAQHPRVVRHLGNQRIPLRAGARQGIDSGQGLRRVALPACSGKGDGDPGHHHNAEVSVHRSFSLQGFRCVVPGGPARVSQAAVGAPIDVAARACSSARPNVRFRATGHPVTQVTTRNQARGGPPAPRREPRPGWGGGRGGGRATNCRDRRGRAARRS